MKDIKEISSDRTMEVHCENVPVMIISQRYLHAATSDNTRAAYQQDILHYVQSGETLPATPDAIMRYLDKYAAVLNSNTLERRLSGIRSWHITQGFDDPTDNIAVRKMLTGIKRVHGKPKDKAVALLLEPLKILCNYLRQSNTLRDLRDNTLLQIHFFGAFRVSELINMKVEWITFFPEGIRILIPRSKTDQEGQGKMIAIACGNETLCPVTALKTWLEAADIKEGYIFRKIDQWGSVGIQPLTRAGVNHIIRRVTQQSGLLSKKPYSSHGLRAGLVTTANRENVPLSLIMKQGGWKKTDTVMEYDQGGGDFEDNIVHRILGANSKIR